MKPSIGAALIAVASCTPASSEPYVALEDSRIVCEKCSEEELDLEIRGIRLASHELIGYVGGSDLMPDYSPVVIHASEDDACPLKPYTVAYANFGHVCLFNHERHFPPCDECPPVGDLPSQKAMIHEGLHEWFRGRLALDYAIEEGFCQFVGLDASRYLVWLRSQGYDVSTDPCTALHGPDAELVKGLCSLGLTGDKAKDILKGTDEAASLKGSPLAADEFASVVSQAIQKDSLPAFRDAGIL